MRSRASQEAWELKFFVKLARFHGAESGLARGLGIEITYKRYAGSNGQRRASQEAWELKYAPDRRRFSPVCRASQEAWELKFLM